MHKLDNAAYRATSLPDDAARETPSGRAERDAVFTGVCITEPKVGSSDASCAKNADSPKKRAIDRARE